MKLQNINSINFSKKAILTCQVKDARTKHKQNATLYSYDPIKNPQDKKELKASFRTARMYAQIEGTSYEAYGNQIFYALKNDDTNDIISCATTSRHYRPDNIKLSGLSTQVDELDSSLKYVNPIELLVVGIVKEAQERSDSSVFFAIHPEETYGMKNIKTSEHKGSSYLPEKRFNSIVDKGVQRSQIEFLG